MIEYAYIETTNYCNLQCSFCNREEVIGALKHMKLSDFEIVLDQIKHHPVHTAKLMGMGEPFLHPKFDQICRRFKETFPDAFVISATNCQYTIKDSFAESLKYIDMLYLSIDGYKDSYEKYRAPSKWDKLIAFLEKLKSLPRYNCRIVCNYVVNPGNIDDIQRVYDEIVLPYNLVELRLNIAQDWSEDKTMPGGYSQEQLAYLRDNWQHCIQGKKVWDYSDCFWVKNGLYTTVDGNVLACCMNTAARPFGNLFVQPIDEIQQSPEFQNVKSGCGSNTPTAHCATCSYKEMTPLLSRLL